MPSLIWVNQFALLPSDGGGTRHFELGRELVRRGWKVTILACDLHLHARHFTRRKSEEDRSAHVEVLDGVEICWLWAARYERNDWRRAWNWFTFYRSVLAELNAERATPDVIIGSSPQIFAAAAARSVAAKLRVPFVFEVRDLWPESLVAAGGRRGVAYWIIDHVAKSLYAAAARVLVLAKGTGNYLAQKGVTREKIVHVPNGVDVDAMRPMQDAAVADVDRPFTLIYAGAHGPANGLDCVLDAAEILRSSGKFRIRLVGDGPVKADLREEAARRGLHNVEFVEPVSKFDLVALFAAADAGLMVLRPAELFSFGVSPNKLFDYLAAGLPVICNVSGEVADMLQESKGGLQCADASGGTLAHCAQRLAAMTTQERAQMGGRGRRWVQQEHGRPVLGERLDGFLRALLPK